MPCRTAPPPGTRALGGLIAGAGTMPPTWWLVAADGAEALDGPTVQAVLEATGGRGADSVIGVHGLDPYPLPMLMSLLRSVTLRMTTAPIQQTRKELVPLVTGGSLRTDGIFTHSSPLAPAAEAFAAVAARSPECLKVLMVP